MTTATPLALRHDYVRYTKGCRCEVCRAAKAAYMATRRSESFLAGMPIPAGIKHGRWAYEERGCRCEVCVEARRASRGAPGWAPAGFRMPRAVALPDPGHPGGRLCAYCEQPLTGKRATAAFCSKQHQDAYRRRAYMEIARLSGQGG